MKTKILFYLGGLHAGGTENYVLRFIKACATDEFNWTVVSASMEKGDLHEAFEKVGCQILYQPVSFFNIWKFYQFYRLLKMEQFDVVCTFDGNFGGIPLTIARLAGVNKRITWYRRSSDAFGDNPLKKGYNQLVNRLVRMNATSILSNSEFALKEFFGNYQNNDPRFRVLYNGVSKQVVETSISKQEVREKLGLPDKVFLVGHVGRTDWAKNHETIFKVAQKFKNEKKNIHFLFCGRGTDSNKFKQKTEHYGINDICHCLGLVENVSWVYKSIDLFFYPSITEGQPNALIEAMLAGLPVVTSNIQPILEILPENMQEFAFNPTDIESFYQKMDLMIERQPLGNNSELVNWAIDQFKPSINFNRFKDELIK